MGKYKIWMRESGAPSSVDMYTEQFKDRGHTLLKKFSGKGDKVIIDVGANEGYYTLKIKQNSPNAKILAIEANPLTFQILKKNIQGNNLRNVLLINSFLGSKVGQTTLEFVPQVSAISSFNLGLQKRPWLKQKDIKKIKVQETTLQHLCTEFKLSQIDLLKLDVEGAEMKILQSSKPLLKSIKKIVVEYHSQALRKGIKHFLTQNNFKLIKEKPESNRCGDLYFVNNSTTL